MKKYAPAMIAAVVLVALLALRAFVSRGVPQADGTCPTPSTGNGEPTFVNIGTGGVTGVYYQVGGAIMKLMSAKESVYGMKVSFQATAGSVYNINTVLASGLDIGIAQSDRQYQAVHGLAEWQERGPQTALRAICSIHPETVTLIAATDSNIRTVTDLRGKKVNIGNPGSGQRGNAIDVLTAAGIDWENDLQAEGIKAAESAKLLQDGRIDAFFYTVGHPAGAITEATVGRRGVTLVPITGMQKLIEAHPYYAEVTIPIRLYPNADNTEDIQTVGVMTTLVTSESVSDDVVYAITKELFENLDEFRAMHPAFADLKADQMLTRGLSAPLHPGALRYYREAGLVRD